MLWVLPFWGGSSCSCWMDALLPGEREWEERTPKLILPPPSATFNTYKGLGGKDVFKLSEQTGNTVPPSVGALQSSSLCVAGKGIQPLLSSPIRTSYVWSRLTLKTLSFSASAFPEWKWSNQELKDSSWSDEIRILTVSLCLSEINNQKQRIFLVFFLYPSPSLIWSEWN